MTSEKSLIMFTDLRMNNFQIYNNMISKDFLKMVI